MLERTSTNQFSEREEQSNVEVELTVLLFARTAVLVGFIEAIDPGCPSSSSVRTTAFSLALDGTGLSGEEEEKE